MGYAVRRSIPEENFLFSKSTEWLQSPSQPPIRQVPGLFSGGKRPGREHNHSPPPNAEVKE